jgi:3-oxoacyl-[acyl-carrier-protein] synthase II
LSLSERHTLITAPETNEVSTRLRRPLICVTGMGVTTSLGIGKQDNWKALLEGRSGVKAIKRFPVDRLRTSIGATVDFDNLGCLPFTVRTERLAEMVLLEALSEAGLNVGKLSGPLFVGVPPAEMSWAQRLALAQDVGLGTKVTYDQLLRVCSDGDYSNLHDLYSAGATASRLADRFGTRGAPVTVNTACATGATVIQLAAESIRRRETDLAIAVASDASIVPDTIIRFSLLAALSMLNDVPEQASRPFSLDRAGFVLGEGAAAIVLENYDSARARGARPIGFIAGCGESADNFHLLRSSPDASAAVAAMKAAVHDSGLSVDQIDYVNAHGTGTQENDRIESLAMTKVFGSRVETIPISSNKSMIGHTMSAAGAVEAVFSLLTIQSDVLPPTINYLIPDPNIRNDVVPNSARAANVNNILSNSFGFGGQNVCLVMSGSPQQ